MKKTETRVVTKEEAVAFIQNMRWFAGLGRITAKKLARDRYKVTASRSAWSYWVRFV